MRRKAIETLEIEARLTVLEGQNDNQRKGIT
jgi:hypothetical protein